MRLSIPVSVLLWTLGAWAEGTELHVARTDIPPKIDGFVEPLWARGDSVTGFVQLFPKEGEPATERTVVHVLCDDENLYVAFECYDSEPGRLILRLAPRDQAFGNAGGDCVGLLLDTFGDKTMGYEFIVNAKGVQGDAYVSSGGKDEDESWDGVWYSAARVTDFGYVVEMAIPFKSIRFKEGSGAWRAMFARYIARRQEWTVWPPFKVEELKRRLSKACRLVGIEPGRIGLHLEAYPVALARYEGSSISPDAGLDLSWYPSPSSSFHLTANPDFAQVEADPYRVNLSKYELYLSERRPFFVEGSEVFRCFGGMPHLFYSRRIARRLPGGKEVPILGASKLIARPGRFELGALVALTGEVEYTKDDSVCIEPRSLFSVFRVKRRFLENSEFGLLYAGKRGGGTFGEVSAIDGELRIGGFRLGFVCAGEHRKGKRRNYGGKVTFSWTTQSFQLNGYAQDVSSDFDISQVGFFPWVGRRELSVWGGPTFWNKGPFRTIFPSLRIWCQREFSEPRPEYSISGGLSLNFTNNWGFYFGFTVGERYQEGELYDLYNISFWAWSDRSKPLSASSGFWYNSRSYNYRREYFAPSGGLGFDLRWRPSPGLSLGLEVNNTVEFKPDGSVEKWNWISHPTVQWALRRDMYLRVWLEPNFATDLHRANVLLSWNFLPKSWAYLAVNESRDNSEGRMKLKERIVVFKLRYLFLL